MKVYILTTGSYSDYRIEAVFRDREKAERKAERINKLSWDGDEAQVEEWPFSDDEKPDDRELVPLLSLYTFVGTQPKDNWKYLQIREGSKHVYKSEARPITRADSSSASLGIAVQVEGCDFERVRKAFSERLAKAKAELEGVA